MNTITFNILDLKKINGGYKLQINNGISVRNQLEKNIGDFLLDCKVRFEYEPFVSINDKAYFPDFKIDNKLIEVTAWKHPNAEKLDRLTKKLTCYTKQGYDVCLFIPPEFVQYYKILDNFIISDLENLKSFVFSCPKSL